MPSFYFRPFDIISGDSHPLEQASQPSAVRSQGQRIRSSPLHFEECVGGRGLCGAGLLHCIGQIL